MPLTLIGESVGEEIMQPALEMIVPKAVNFRLPKANPVHRRANYKR